MFSVLTYSKENEGIEMKTEKRRNFIRLQKKEKKKGREEDGKRKEREERGREEEWRDKNKNDRR